MNLELIMLSKISHERQILYVIIHMWNLIKIKQTNVHKKAETDSQI